MSDKELDRFNEIFNSFNKASEYHKCWETVGKITAIDVECKQCNLRYTTLISEYKDKDKNFVCIDCQELIDIMNNREDKINDILNGTGM